MHAAEPRALELYLNDIYININLIDFFIGYSVTDHSLRRKGRRSNLMVDSGSHLSGYDVKYLTINR